MVREGLGFAAFTERGRALAGRLQSVLGGTLRSAEEDLGAWVEKEFPHREALIFIGAAGIAVRAVAPRLRGKAEDPAVIVLDEYGRFAIPLLSGHLGGANALAERIAQVCGATAVITTATDLNAVFAVDLWAKRQNMTVLQPERIRTVSARLLRKERVRIECRWPVEGTIPQNLEVGSPGDVVVDYRPAGGGALQLVPHLLCLGVGCRRGISPETLEQVFARFCEERSILPQALAGAASIDCKRDEEGLLRFCEKRDLPIRFFSAEELRCVPGCFSASAFVERTVGVDNVCERAAVLAGGGELIERKYAADGVSLALAEAELRPDWSW